MKKLVLFLIIALGAIGFVNGQQLGNPIRPYRESGYTPDEVKNFALGSSQVSVSYRNELIRLVNKGLRDAGETMLVDETNISWILANVHPIHVSLDGGTYRNSRILNGSFNIYNDRENFSGSVAEFRYGSCKKILYKLICMNLLDVRESNFSQQREPTLTFTPEPTFTPSETTYVPSVVLKTDVFSPPVLNPSITDLSSKREKTWFGKNWWWVTPVAAGIIGGGVYLLTRPRPIPIESRSMPPGIPAYTPGSNGGVDADPRGMPSGYGMRTNFGPPVPSGIPVFRF